MDVFGEQWRNHPERIRKAWIEMISTEDIVLIAGDISWAMRHEEVKPDLHYLFELPGTKVLLRGNHDYWWGTRSKVETWAGPSCRILQHNAIAFPSFAVVGSKGWEQPTQGSNTAEEYTLYQREVDRLRLSLEAGRQTGLPLLAMTHFPPLTNAQIGTPVSDLLEEYQVKLCVYGHLHGNAHKNRVEGTVRGVQYLLTSADYLNFVPRELNLASGSSVQTLPLDSRNPL